MDITQVRALAEQHYGEAMREDGPDASMFALLVDVADAYVQELERQAADDPAPFFAGSTPMTAALEGLRENLEMIREPHLAGSEPADGVDE